MVPASILLWSRWQSCQHQVFRNYEGGPKTINLSQKTTLFVCFIFLFAFWGAMFPGFPPCSGQWHLKGKTKPSSTLQPGRDLSRHRESWAAPSFLPWPSQGRSITSGNCIEGRCLDQMQSKEPDAVHPRDLNLSSLRGFPLADAVGSKWESPSTGSTPA